MAEPITLSAAEINQAVYLAIATAKGDAETDLLAGITCHMLLAHPGLSTQEIEDAITGLHGAIAANRPDPQFDLSPNDSILMSRILTRVVPALTTSNLRDGAKLYARAFLNSYRRDTGQLRQVGPIELQFDRLGEVERFRRDTWQQLYELARDNPAIANVINQSEIAEALGVATTQDATTLLHLVALQPLTTFVTDHLQPDGGLVVTPDDIVAVLTGVSASMEELRKSYADNLVEINRAEQQTRDEAALRSAGFVFRARALGDALLSPAVDRMALAGAGRDDGEIGEEQSPLERAIKKAEEKQKDLDELLKGIGEGSKSVLSVLAFSAERFDDEFATDIREFATITTTMLDSISKVAKAAIGTAKVVEKIIGAGSSTLLLGGAIGLNFALIAIAIQIFGLFGKPRTKPVEQVILEQLEKISKQITRLRDEMRVRFDRIDRRLDRMYVEIMNQFATIDFELGQIEGNVEEIQIALYDLHTELQRLNRNLHEFLVAAHRRDLVEAINGFLNFRELTFEDFVKGENVFFSWGFSHAKDSLQAGPVNRRFQDNDLFTELTAFPLATNVNYLRQLPSERFALPSLSLNRLANPFDWIVACEAYAQLNEESPGHAGQISSDRVESLIGIGEVLGASLAKIADNDLFAALAAQYRFGFAQLKNAIVAFEHEFRIDPDIRLYGIDLWGGAEQIPSTHFFRGAFDELPRCDGKKFDAATNTNTVVTPGFLKLFDHSQLLPYMVASNLHDSQTSGVAEGLDKLSACVVALWGMTEPPRPLGLGGLVELKYGLTIVVQIRYGASTVFAHRFDTPERLLVIVPSDQVAGFDPATDSRGKDPYRLLVDPDKQVWNKLETFPASHSIVSPALRTATIATVQHKLILLQRAFYTEVARRFELPGDPIQEAGQRLTGSKLLWQSFIVTGLPLSIEANEILRSFLFGSEALLAGADTESQDTLLDDIQDIYTYFSIRDEDPLPVNILGDIETIVNDRLERLTSILTEIVETIETSGQPEPPELFAPTLLRLSLIHS